MNCQKNNVVLKLKNARQNNNNNNNNNTHTNKQTRKQAHEQTNKQANYKLVKHKFNCKSKIQPYMDIKQQLNHMQCKHDQK